MRGVTRTLFIGIGLVALSLISGLVGSFISKTYISSSPNISYTDFISLMLTAISVLMTILAIFLGALGIIGWNAISSKVRSKTDEFLSDGFEEGNHLHDILRRRATEIMYEGVAPLRPENGEEEYTDEGAEE
ncbi:hypothetical protein [Euryhalocaulis caribicus]|uniref:hypothetical protein n=1 Tax=Euryhalocaulis caribicus TaxID=1161401 RepID=UPI0012690FAC|nr:hypothetical protein [Euryhalocaulis caribicus]